MPKLSLFPSPLNPAEPPNPAPTHRGVSCDGPHCQAQPDGAFIVGTRYKCVECPNVDFCEACVRSLQNEHAHTSWWVFMTPEAVQVLAGKGLQTFSFGEMKERARRNHFHQHLAPRMQPEMEPAIAGLAVLRVAEDDGVDEPPPPLPLPLTPIPMIYPGATVPRPREPESTKDLDRTVHFNKEVQMKVEAGEVRRYYYGDPTFYALASKDQPVTRIVRLLPGAPHSMLECSLETVNLNEPLKHAYDAVSYTWNAGEYDALEPLGSVESNVRLDPSSTFAVYLPESHAFIPVTLPLYNCLRHLRHPTEARYLWADQISINQMSLRERSFQVSYMRWVYTRASSVLLWAGSASAVMGSIFRLFRRLGRYHSLTQNGLLIPFDIEDSGEILGLPPLQSPVWPATLEFFKRPVFQRGWIIQEVTVSNQVRVICGPEQTAWEDIAYTAQVLQSPPWKGLSWASDVDAATVRAHRLAIVEHAKAYSTHEETKGPSSRLPPIPSLPDYGRPEFVVSMQNFRDTYHTPSGSRLVSIIQDAQLFRTTDPRDKIYALLGLRLQGRDEVPFAPDYERSTQETFIMATKWMVENESSLEVCTMALDIHPGLQATLSTDKWEDIGELPSWCPDFRRQNRVTAFTRGSRWSAAGEASTKARATWPAGEGARALMETPAYLVDVIADTLDENMVMKSPEDDILWTRLAASLGQVYPTGETTTEAFYKTYAGAANTKGRSYPASMFEEFVTIVVASSALMDQHAALARENENEILAALTERGKRIPPWYLNSYVRDHRDLAFDYKDSVMFRKLFVTRGGFMGLAPLRARKGDGVFVLPGSRVPVILRRGGEDVELETQKPQEPYSLVGDAFVHGLMEGQALERKGFAWSNICIC